ncbi:YjfI family protein [Dyella subtropica]|uniref:YjfI family protein n=1 Tax=Dyella subtropica TaxID=2992127 RepID=UPI00225ACD6A|nr:DUF2170 family protein [Dyella subtropica]
MREQGLVPEQVYIRKEHKEALARIEQMLRMPVLPPYVYLMDNDAMSQNWTTQSLFEALKESDYCKEGLASVAMHHGSEQTIHIEAHDHHDLQMQMLASGSEVHVSTVLCRADQVKDRATFNEACLRLNTIYPLSNLGLSRISGEDAYIMFGQLSARAPLANVIEEIHTLGHNALQAANELSTHIH